MALTLVSDKAVHPVSRHANMVRDNLLYAGRVSQDSNSITDYLRFIRALPVSDYLDELGRVSHVYKRLHERRYNCDTKEYPIIDPYIEDCRVRLDAYALRARRTISVMQPVTPKTIPNNCLVKMCDTALSRYQGMPKHSDEFAQVGMTLQMLMLTY